MEPRPPLSSLTADQLMERAREYRRMACTASTVEIRDALNRLAIRLARLAAEREAQAGRVSIRRSASAVGAVRSTPGAGAAALTLTLAVDHATGAACGEALLSWVRDYTETKWEGEISNLLKRLIKADVAQW